ncbi:flagellar hook-length control protein FliK [Shewanella xiamenensis]|uniref:flagellar hook-length control protein FliK n=1 Tax=Shewanella xiamenensis TaxID=332186 RepID=UPI0024A71DE5|nr:flagellar hook-length control protein FliK [Shewanella xiamenensis]MDI5836475.1 flagellar hook-length control protein FliK [Shewanella xiamenensis]MDI5840794.1 flagellar hook-length control protein FliK [Shewanella xiamenensis]MDI5844715.1 flagellar hook-length control protein FliK [Shewanella xiamenensis]MDI5848752.1 flagellar hook-length control protein FliK [Shewanella xiamenensis]MDI5852640.1 flagellar hook-length control protein FliK [Shewanella xiamenensis]
MQQMNNILLVSSAKNGTGSSKILGQDANSEDFSATWASVTSISSSSTNTNVSPDVSAKSTKQKTDIDDTSADDEADISLIFAQIGMANEMKKAAAPSDSLPLEAQLTTEDAASILAPATEDGALPTEETIKPTFLDDLAKFAQSHEATLTNDSLDETIGEQVLDQANVVEHLQQLPQNQPLGFQQDEISGDQENIASSLQDIAPRQAPPINTVGLIATANTETVDKTGASTDDTLIDDASMLAEMRTEKWVKPPEPPILPIEGESISEANKLEVKEAELSNKSINLSLPSIDKTIAPTVGQSPSVNTANVSVTDADAVILNSTTKELNALGAVSVEPNAIDDNPSRAEISAGLLLKDAKLAVTLDSRQENALSSLDTGHEESVTEFKPADFKAVSIQHSLANQQIQRQEIPQVHLSLRQGVENQNQMQEMIQRFSPVMKQQLVTMVSQGIQQAEIRLDPPELGHMIVKIQVHGEQTQVQFHVAQAQTRDVVEQAIPRLRELLQEQGMQLADSHVSQGDQGQRREGGFADSGGSSGGNVDDFSAEELDLGLNQATSLNSGIDYYA